MKILTTKVGLLNVMPSFGKWLTKSYRSKRQIRSTWEGLRYLKCNHTLMFIFHYRTYIEKLGIVFSINENKLANSTENTIHAQAVWARTHLNRID